MNADPEKIELFRRIYIRHPRKHYWQFQPDHFAFRLLNESFPNQALKKLVKSARRQSG